MVTDGIEAKEINADYAKSLKTILKLRWSPVALKMVRPEEDIPPGVYAPSSTIRHCQSLIAARRGHSLYIPAKYHACPDGSAILGIVPMSAKLRSGELYLLFKKLPDIQTARKMISTRQEFSAGDYKATAVSPLEKAEYTPDVVIMTLEPEQMMWLCCASTYSSGDRQVFHTSGYNSACADLVVNVIRNGKMNISLGCYGARASSDVGDNELYVSIPYSQLPAVINALEKLAKKSIPEARARVYLPPVIDRLPAVDSDITAGTARIIINRELCSGCGTCAAFCPESVFIVKNGKAETVNTGNCCICHTCVGQCPEKAIRIL